MMLHNVLKEILLQQSSDAFRCCREVNAGQHVHCAICGSDGSTRRQSTKCGSRSRPVERFNIPQNPLEEARDNDRSRQRLHHDRHPESDRLEVATHPHKLLHAFLMSI